MARRFEKESRFCAVLKAKVTVYAKARWSKSESPSAAARKKQIVVESVMRNRLWLRLDGLVHNLEEITRAYMSVDRAASAVNASRRATRKWSPPVCMQDVLDEMTTPWDARCVKT